MIEEKEDKEEQQDKPVEQQDKPVEAQGKSATASGNKMKRMPRMPFKNQLKQLDEIHALKDYDVAASRQIDCDEFAREVKEAQDYAAEHGIDMRCDFSAISDSLAKKIMQCCNFVAREPRFADLTWALEDDCVSNGCLYCMKYGVKNYNPEKCFGRIIPYFKQVARSGFYRVLNKWLKQKRLEDEAKKRDLDAYAVEMQQVQKNV